MTSSALRSPAGQRLRTWRWIGLALVVILALAGVTAWLTAPRPGGHLDPESTSPDGAHAVVTLLRDQGVDVQVACTAADAVRMSGPDALLLVAQTYYLYDDAVVSALEAAQGDLLLVEPNTQVRKALAPDIRFAPKGAIGGQPNCDLREANQAGTVRFGSTNSYEAVNAATNLTSCYDGALVRYRDGDRNITAVSTADFMTNSTLLSEGNAALALNLAGASPRLIWYAPQRAEGERTGAKDIFELIPDRFTWIIAQLVLTVALIALWKSRRMGPLVAEQLPVVVRASETVEGRGRLYRSRRARDRAAQALRTATLQRLAPRLGLGTNPEPTALVQALVQNAQQRSAHPGLSTDPMTLHHNLFGPPPATDDDLVQLALALDNIERQVTRS